MPVAPLHTGCACGDRMVTQRSGTPPGMAAGGALLSAALCRCHGATTTLVAVNMHCLALCKEGLKYVTIGFSVYCHDFNVNTFRGFTMTSRRQFTDDQVREIRQSHRSARELAEGHGVSHPTILNIRDRRTYKDVPDQLGMEIKNRYVLGDPLDFLAELPDGYCGTAVTASPIREKPSIIGRSSGWTGNDERKAEGEYVELQRSVIKECLRVVGPTGVLLYHYRYEISSRRGMDLRHNLISDFPLRQAIIWNHQMRRFIPGGRHLNRVPNNYGMIFIFSGPRWSIPKESKAAAMAWGDVWDIKPDHGDDLWVSMSHRRGQRHPYSFPAELADRCVALGSGMVVDPFAATGSTALAAIRAGRDWLACDSDPACLEAFQMRLAMMS